MLFMLAVSHWIAPRPVPLDAARGAASSPVSVSATRRSALWLLAVGVSRYQQTDLNIQFADDDARAIAAVLAAQSNGPLYRQARTLVLTDEQVTREGVLDAMEHFLGRAGRDDVAAIFLAGHGVEDTATSSYYFLTYGATVDNLHTVALRMSDFDEMVRLLRGSVRGVVVMLDTCHAGGLHVGTTRPASDFVSSLSGGDGFFLLAATRPGEASEEIATLRHGAFTQALIEGLAGAADADRDGFVSASELFGYVARSVPRRTGQRQHPYHKVEGTDLLLAAVTPGGPTPAVFEPVAEGELQTEPAPPRAREPNSIAVKEFRNLQGAAQYAWMGNALRVAFNTELSKVRVLRVYAPELIDRAVTHSGVGHLETARQMGIEKLVTGSFQVVGDGIRIDAQIVDTATGLQEGSDSVQGTLADFFDLEKRLVLSMLRRLRVKVSAGEGASIERDTNNDVDAYRLLLQSEGLLKEPTPSPALTVPGIPPQPREPRSQRSTTPRRFTRLLLGVAYAEEPAAGALEEIQRFLDSYRRALETKDVSALATLYVAFPDDQRDTVGAYLANADNLTVTIGDVSVQTRGGETIVSYTRQDRFVDHKTGRPVHLEVRLTKVLVRESGRWRIGS
jgi:TolB-like protein/ketosteroid isomerase-like protein